MQPISIVIPYKSMKQGRELKLALRSWQKNFLHPHHIVLIGDKEDWIDDTAITYIPYDQPSSNAQQNTTTIMRMAASDSRVSQQFIWTYDDIYLANPVELCQLQMPIVKGTLDKTHGTGVYPKNMKATYELLKQHGVSTLHYDVHRPFVFAKAKLESMMELFPILRNGSYLLPSVYYNIYSSALPYRMNGENDHFFHAVVRKDKFDLTTFNTWLTTRLWINNEAEGFTPEMEKRLHEVFPEKSKFEL